MRSQAATPLIEAKTSCPHDDHHDDDDDCVFLEPDDDGEFEFLPPGDRIRSDAAADATDPAGKKTWSKVA